MNWAESFLAAHPDTEVLEAFLVDVNGQARGKWIPIDTAGKAFKGELRMPRSAYAVDIWGADVLDAGLVVDTGDSDGICAPVKHSLAIVPWLQRPTAQLLLSMQDPDGTDFFGDPRHVLAHILSRFKQQGWTPVVAFELEFYFTDINTENDRPVPPLSPMTGARLDSPQVYSVSEMQEFETVLAGIARSCIQQNIQADTTISENGPGQYEINFNHLDDALLASDQAIQMKRAVKGLARANGLEATFMAKPYSEHPGNGLHLHFSIIDDKGNNLFAGVDKFGSTRLRNAIGGVLATMPEYMAIFASNANSYRRFQIGSHAPTTASWGYDNRSSAVRVPDSNLAATRIEHRVAGADANPYLVMAAVLAGAYKGMVERTDADDPVEGDSYSADKNKLPTLWESSLCAFERSAAVAEYFGADFQAMYTACKRQEKKQLDLRITDVEYNAYLRRV